MALVAESRAGALRACVQEHVDVTLNEVGEQAFDIILRDVSPQYRNIFVKLYNQTVQLVKQNTLEELEVICSDAGLLKKFESLDALSKECGISGNEKTLEALRISATSENPQDVLRKSTIALKRKEKESLKQQLEALNDRKASLATQVEERRETVQSLMKKLNGVESTMMKQ